MGKKEKKKKKKDEIKSAKEISEEKAQEAEQRISEESTKTEEQKEGQQGPALELTFSSYLIMLGALGWQFLGKVPNPATGKIEKDLLQAKQIIDLLEILEQKTKNNLTPDEENILKTTLVNLRLNYVDEVKKSEKQEGGK